MSFGFPFKRNHLLTLPILALLVLLAAPSPAATAMQTSDEKAQQVSLAAGASSLDAPSDTRVAPPRFSPDVPNPPIGFALDDGTAERAIGYGSTSTNRTAAAIWLNHFSPGNVTYPLTLEWIQIMFPGPEAGNFVGNQIRLLVYRDVDSDGDPSNATLIFQQVAVIQVADWETFQAFPVNVVVNSPGDLYIGWEDAWAESGPSPFQYIAAQDSTASQRRSWFAANRDSPVPNINNLGLNYYLGIVDDIFEFPGNWMIRAVGRTADPATATPTRPPAATATPCTVGRFSDVPPDHTFYQSITCLVNRGIVSGYADCTFRPNNLVTRSQLAKIVSNAANFQEDPGPQVFHDVPPGHPFYEWINRLTNRGYMAGYTCGSPGEPCVNNRPYFRPFNNATRAQTSKIVSNAAQYNEPPTGQTFEDVPPAHPFYTEIQRLASRGIMGGYNCGGAGEPCGIGNRPYFRPYNDVTRGQSAKIVANAFYPACQTR